MMTTTLRIILSTEDEQEALEITTKLVERLEGSSDIVEDVYIEEIPRLE